VRVFERFTDAARQVLVLAQEEARLLHSSKIGTEHLLLGLIREDGPASTILDSFEVSLSALRQLVTPTTLPGPHAGPHSGLPAAWPFSPRAKKVLELSLRETLQLGHSDIGPEHLLLGLIREGEGTGAQMLIGLGVDLSLLRQRLIAALMEGDPSTPHLPHSSLQRGRSVRDARLVACSFCGLTPPASGQLVSGDNAFICERCIEHWFQYIRAATSRIVSPAVWPSAPPSEVISTGPPPADVDAARAEIQAAYSAHGTTSEDGISIPSVERGHDLGPTIAMAKSMARNRGIDPEASEVAVIVDEVRFVDAEHAAVWFSISIDGRPVVVHHRGDALVVAGEWKMTRTTFCQIMLMGGVPCPPDEGG